MSTILLLENEPIVMSLMVRVLKSSGHVILQASSVAEAFQLFEEVDACIDLLIADVDLPVSSGIRAAVEFQSLLPNLRIILTSGHTPDMWKHATEIEDLRCGSVSILQKPFLPATLRQAVSRFVEAVNRPGVALARAALD